MPEDTANAPQAVTEHQLARRVVLFVFVWVFWLLLAWPVAPSDGRLLWGEIGAGAVVAILVALISREVMTQRFGRLFELTRYFWAVIYLFVFAWYVIKANFDVAYRVLHPSMPIRPGIVRASTSLATDSARTLLAISITLTPGTLAMEVAEDGVFYVHWINVQTTTEEAAARRILSRFEWFVGKILE